MANILIVDDQQCIRELLSEELMCEGYRVESVGDAESVTGHLRFSRPDLVLLDLYLDGLDGWEVLRHIKRQDPYLPIIIFTAYDSFVDDPRLSQADGYVIKSIDLDELKQKIANVLSRKSAPQGKVEAKSHLPQFSAAHGFGKA
ncbi:MAG: response regulator [Deltaproteobacteria bacterium]|nr:response regulator [Deltaproteobacteria bacterium]